MKIHAQFQGLKIGLERNTEGDGITPNRFYQSAQEPGIDGVKP